MACCPRDDGRRRLWLEYALVALSVVVPTYKRSCLVKTCLDSLQRQTLQTFELLVVDNSPDSELRVLVEDFNATATRPATYVHEPRLGLHNARHAGARAGTGDVLVFTDDDATFDPDWLAAYAHAFDAHPDMVAAGGPILPTWQTRPPDWLTRLIAVDPSMFPALSLLDRGREFALTRDGFFFGVNMAVRRQALFEAGGFNPEIFGDRWLGDGETGLNRKLWARGYAIGYVPKAVVYHLVSAERMTLGYLRRRQANDGACDMYARFHDSMPSPVGLARAAAAVVIESARDWAAEPLFRGRTDLRALRVQLRAVRAWARLQYVGRLMLTPSLRALVVKKDWL
jgi:glycosyltransferase involved in cell wall biosynthesis